jgi:hypothetical protein
MGDSDAMSGRDNDGYDRPEWPDDVSGWIGLGPRAGDEGPRRGSYPNARWGATELLELGKSVTLVVTPVFRDPCPIGYQLRFSTDGINFSATMPAGRGIDVTLIKSFDLKAGVANERFGIDPGQTQPTCQVIARSLTITAKAAETSLGALHIQAVACPLMTLDCEVVIPTPPAVSTPTRFQLTDPARYAAAVASTYTIPVSADRAYFCIVNQSAANLFISLGGDVDTTPGSELATIVLPPDAFGGYEVLNYAGQITFKFDADDADGYALATNGYYPP